MEADTQDLSWDSSYVLVFTFLILFVHGNQKLEVLDRDQNLVPCIDQRTLMPLLQKKQWLGPLLQTLECQNIRHSQTPHGLGASRPYQIHPYSTVEKSSQAPSWMDTLCHGSPPTAASPCLPSEAIHFQLTPSKPHLPAAAWGRWTASSKAAKSCMAIAQCAAKRRRTGKI